jgi:hypothetical protein
MYLKFCAVCGKTPVEYHHFIPKEMGGSDDETNKEPLCGTCHGIKHGIERSMYLGKLIQEGIYKSNSRPFDEKKEVLENKIQLVRNSIQELQDREKFHQKFLEDELIFREKLKELRDKRETIQTLKNEKNALQERMMKELRNKMVVIQNRKKKLFPWKRDITILLLTQKRKFYHKIAKDYSIKIQEYKQIMININSIVLESEIKNFVKVIATPTILTSAKSTTKSNQSIAKIKVEHINKNKTLSFRGTITAPCSYKDNYYHCEFLEESSNIQIDIKAETLNEFYCSLIRAHYSIKILDSHPKLPIWSARITQRTNEKSHD